MTSFKCCYSGRVNNENSIRTEMLEANDARQAYEKFLANQGQFPEAVYVSCEYGERLFEDHIPEARAKAFLEKNCGRETGDRAPYCDQKGRGIAVFH